MPTEKLEALHVSRHPVAAGMDVEGDNYIVTRNGDIPIITIPLDETIKELKGKLSRVDQLQEANRRIEELVTSLGETSLQ